VDLAGSVGSIGPERTPTDRNIGSDGVPDQSIGGSLLARSMGSLVDQSPTGIQVNQTNRAKASSTHPRSLGRTLCARATA